MTSQFDYFTPFVESGRKEFTIICDSQQPDKRMELIKKGVEKGVVDTADTIEELAEAAGLPSYPLMKTIERYNELAAAGNDEDFGKRADRLFPVEEGPFYAYPLTDTVILVNMGGLQTDVDFNVMDTEDEVIEGLYAVGNAQGGRFLVDYPLPAPGISHGMALTHGMLVGRILAQL